MALRMAYHGTDLEIKVKWPVRHNFG